MIHSFSGSLVCQSLVIAGQTENDLDSGSLAEGTDADYRSEVASNL